MVDGRPKYFAPVSLVAIIAISDELTATTEVYPEYLILVSRVCYNCHQRRIDGDSRGPSQISTHPISVSGVAITAICGGIESDW